MTDMPPLVDGLIALLVLVGAGFALLGSVGLVRLGDIFTRLHGPTKATTLGVGGVLTASMLFFWSRGHFSVHELLITLFLVVTAPVSAYLIAQAALHRRCKSLVPLPAADEPPSLEATSADAHGGEKTPSAGPPAQPGPSLLSTASNRASDLS